MREKKYAGTQRNFRASLTDYEDAREKRRKTRENERKINPNKVTMKMSVGAYAFRSEFFGTSEFGREKRT